MASRCRRQRSWCRSIAVALAASCVVSPGAAAGMAGRATMRAAWIPQTVIRTGASTIHGAGRRRAQVTTLVRPAGAADGEIAQNLGMPASFKSGFLKTLKDRGFIHQCTDFQGLDEAASTGTPVAAYLGFDATAPSLHVGSLLQIMILRHLQKAGHKPIVLMGGGTTKVGDPSGKDESRKLMTYDMIQDNIDSISQVFRRFLKFGDGPTDAVLVNNDEWLSPIKYLDFLRDYGQHFTINRMMNFESVKLRLDREQPLTFLEFNYMILQAYDFLELNRRYKAVLQLGGSDQWGNIINGVELTRKVEGKNVIGLTAPLITTSDGKKMGKTASGAVWLKRDLLSEYDYWQFWRNTADADVIRFLKLFTELSMEEIDELAKLEGADINKAKVILADEATKLLHGEECLTEIHATVSNLFTSQGGASTTALPRVVLTPAELGDGIMVAELFVRLDMAKSKNEARRLIKGGGAKQDGEVIKEETKVLTAAEFKGKTGESSMFERLFNIIAPFPSPQKRFEGILSKGQAGVALRIIDEVIVKGAGESANDPQEGQDAGDDLTWATEVELDLANEEGLRPVHLAAQRGLTDVVSSLVSKVGVDVNAPDADGNTPLHWAAYRGEASTIEWLLQHGAERERLNQDNKTAADVACLPEFSALIKGYTRSTTTTPTPEASTGATDTPKDKQQQPQQQLTPVTDQAPVSTPNGTGGGAAAAQQQEAATGTGLPQTTPPTNEVLYSMAPPPPSAVRTEAAAPLVLSTPTPPLFSTPVKPPRHTGSMSSARRRYSVSPAVTKTPRTVEPRLTDAVLRAAVDTATCLASPTADWARRKEIFDACALYRATPDHAKIRGLETKLREDPALTAVRSVQLNNLAQDGFTPLHAAASVGNLHAIELLLNVTDNPADVFAVDLQGRTALHVAAENGHVEVCRRLKLEMKRRHRMDKEPVGEHAPVDLAGRTPLAWSARRKRQDIEEELFALGDPSIFPSVPLHSRSGGEELAYGYCSTPGWNDKMEDTVSVTTPLDEDDEHTGLFAVFDGHAGAAAAEFAADRLWDTLSETVTWQSGDRSEGALRQALHDTCLGLDARLQALPRFKIRQVETMGVGREAGKVMSNKAVADDMSGSTAIIGLVTHSLICAANLGDSRALLLTRSGASAGPLTAVPLSQDHKPDLPDERLRVEQAGGIVKAIELASDKDEESTLIWRIYREERTKDSIAMSRALGDFVYKNQPSLPADKQMVIAVPEIIVRPRNDQDEYLLLACDGVWDVMSNEDIAHFIYAYEQKQARPTGRLQLADLSDEIVKESMRRGSRDNITVLVVKLRPQIEGRNLFADEEQV